MFSYWGFGRFNSVQASGIVKTSGVTRGISTVFVKIGSESIEVKGSRSGIPETALSTWT